MKEILTNIWNANPSTVANSIGQAVTIISIAAIIFILIISVLAWYMHKRFMKKHFSDPFFKKYE